MAVEKMRQGKRKFERKKKKCNLCREEMEVTEELKNYETAVNKGHHNVGSSPSRCCGFFANAFPPLI